jgi:hypothetical protein
MSSIGLTGLFIWRIVAAGRHDAQHNQHRKEPFAFDSHFPLLSLNLVDSDFA